MIGFITLQQSASSQMTWCPKLLSTCKRLYGCFRVQSCVKKRARFRDLDADAVHALATLLEDESCGSITMLLMFMFAYVYVCLCLCYIRES